MNRATLSILRLAPSALALWALLGTQAAAEEPVKIAFEKTQLDTVFRSEGVAAGDFNQAGKLDIAAGMVWYEAPDWKMHSIVEKTPEYNPMGYSNSFCTFAEDLNGDGWTDIIVVDFPGTPTWWFENSQGKEGPWKRHTLTPVTNNESPQMIDFDGDGKLELLAAVAPDPKQPDAPQRRMAWLSRGEKPEDAWHVHAISAAGAPGTTKYAHGLGFGDVNGDGRNDILTAEGWWEAPETLSDDEWPFHPVDFGGKTAHIYAYDFDGDGDSDVLSSSAHAFGIWWTENLGDGNWKRHEIDTSFSQTHSLCLADINGDGLMDFVTGKRWWAHGPKGDPGSDGPAVMHWFELRRTAKGPEWVSHQFDHDSGIGTQFEVRDMNGDGLLDVITSNKKGVHLFLQRRS